VTFLALVRTAGGLGLALSAFACRKRLPRTRTFWLCQKSALGGIAQLGERVLCKHEVVGSIPSASTIFDALSAGAYLSAFWTRGPERSEGKAKWPPPGRGAPSQASER
jgi:hypothetical protein